MTAVSVVTKSAVKGNWTHQIEVKKGKKAGAQQTVAVMAFHSAKRFRRGL